MWTKSIKIDNFDKWLSTRKNRIPSGNRDPYTSSMRSASRFISALTGNAESREAQQLTDLTSAQLYDRLNDSKSSLAEALLTRCSQLGIPMDDELAIILTLFLEALRCNNAYYKDIIKFWYEISKKIAISEISNNINVSYLISYFSVQDKETGYMPLNDIIDDLSHTDLSSVEISELLDLPLSEDSKAAVGKMSETIKGYATRSSRKEMFQALDVMFSFDKNTRIDAIRPIGKDSDRNRLLKSIVLYYSEYFSFSCLLYDTDILGACFEKSMRPINLPLQQIYYGAPGTGKSYEIDKITKKYGAIRTTFHPDSDYSTFVGAYKPMMEEVDVRIVPVAVAEGIKFDTNNGTYKEKRITYKFVKQAFLKAYLSAWKKYAEGDESGVAPQFIVIEEINRGNCAQIFGDLFQLLDRQDNGFSSYPIEADADLQREIAEAFKAEKDYMLTKELNLQGIVKDYVGNLEEDIKSGKILLLPSNFYIWATMNTSDQSLFPIDSAFKRRWDWKYVKIADAKKDYKIKCGDETCDWWTFISAMNEKIADETSSDDKKLGYFFCKPMKEGEPINVERFVSKVMFYLWNDVFKDGNTQYFNVNSDTTKNATFDAFYNDDNTVNVANVRKFIVNIVGEKILEKESNEMPPQEEFDDPVNKIDYTKYSFDGNDRLSKKDLGVKIVEKYINEHADESFAVLQKALDFGDKVENKYQYHGVLARTEEVTNSYQNCFVNKEITSSDGVKYKVLSWWNKYNISFIIDFAKQQGWEVTESKG